MQQEAAQELVEGESQESLLVAVSRIPPAEGHLAVGERNQPLIGDGNTMGVTAAVAQRLAGTAERRL